MLDKIRRVCKRFRHALLVLKDTKALQDRTPESRFGSLHHSVPASGASVSIATDHNLNLTISQQPQHPRAHQIMVTLTQDAESHD